MTRGKKFNRLLFVVLLSIGFGLSCDTKKPINVPAIIEDAEYEVYSAVLLNRLSHNPKREIFIFQQQTVNIHKLEEDTLAYWGKAFQMKFDSELVDDFNARNMKRYKLENKFSVPVKVVLISGQEIKELIDGGDWSKFYKKYPNSGGINEFSRVGFNKDRTQAILCFGGYGGSLAGGGDFILLNKENGKWIEKRRFIAWIS